MRNTTKTRPAEAPAGAKNPPQPKRNVPDTSKFPTPGPVFFLIFDRANVEPSLTNKESNTYKSIIHFDTHSVKTCQREIFPN
jgi:hypothetical protein